MHPAGRRLTACRHTEFLKRVRERKRQVRVVVEIAVHRAVERVGNAGAQTTRDRNRHAVVAIEVLQHLACVDGGTGEHDQVGHVAPLQRQLDDLGLLDHVTDTGCADVDQWRRALDGDGLLQVSHREHNVDRRHATDLQHDAALHVGAESLQRDFQPVRAGGQVRQDVGPVGLGDHAAHESGVGLHDRDGHARQHTAAFIADRAIELRRCLATGDTVEHQQPRHEQQDTPEGAHHLRPPEPMPAGTLVGT